MEKDILNSVKNEIEANILKTIRGYMIEKRTNCIRLESRYIKDNIVYVLQKYGFKVLTASKTVDTGVFKKKRVDKEFVYISTENLSDDVIIKSATYINPNAVF